MNIDLSTAVGILGTFLAFLEIWKPKICLAIEAVLDSIIEAVISYRAAMCSVLREAGGHADYVFGEVLKGPQPKTFEQFKADQYAAPERYKIYGLGYLSLLTYFPILKPLKLLVSFLNFVGKGKAVGGIGIILNIYGLYLGWSV